MSAAARGGRTALTLSRAELAASRAAAAMSESLTPVRAAAFLAPLVAASATCLVARLMVLWSPPAALICGWGGSGGVAA